MLPAEPKPPERREVHYSGTVQGVGFRYTVRSLARRYRVAGYVQNLPDGRVRLVVEGEPDELGRLLEAVGAQMGNYIRHVEQTITPARGDLKGFEIRF